MSRSYSLSMNRLLPFAAALALLASPAVAATAPLSIPALVKKAEPAIVTVVGYDENDEPQQLGTGFFIDRRGYLVTNRHVLAGAFRAEVKTKSGQTYPVTRVLADNPEVDLVKVKVDIPFLRVRTLKLSTVSPQAGQRIVVIGSPFGLEQTVSDGIVSTVRDAGELGRMVQITAPISSGSSGSPVINEAGSVIGIATIQLATGQNLNFAIPTRRLSDLAEYESPKFGDWAAEAYRSEALSEAASGDFEASHDNYMRALKLRPDWSQAVDGLGMSLHAMGRYDEAFEAYRAAAELDPKYPPSRFHLGEIYAQRGDWKQAVASFEEAIRLQPDYAAAYRSSIDAYLHLGDRGTAHERYLKLQGLDPALAKQASADFELQADAGTH